MTHFICASILLFAFPLAAVSQTKTIILVPGAGHGAWCWTKVTPLLEAAGYNTIEINLPGVNRDFARLANHRLNDDVTEVLKAANKVKGEVILLGHSSGGVIISQAAEQLGTHKVAKLIYLDAFLPQNNESVSMIVERLVKRQTTSDKNLNLPPDQRMIISEDRKSFIWNPAIVQELFYHDCPPEDVEYAKAHLTWQSFATLGTPVHLTDEVYGKIKKYYILCTESKDLNKRSLTSDVHCEKVFELPASHSPFFSMPEKLVEIITSL